MTCTSPITAYHTEWGVVFQENQRTGSNGKEIKLPCGQCQGCRLRRRGDWELRITHEAKCWEANCFVTLTYDDARIPPGWTLRYADVQAFLKRLRWHRGKTRHYTCGEYGPTTQRPHYHTCLFGQDFRNRTPQGKSESGQTYYTDPELTKLWPHGFATVQDLTPETAAYAAGYIMKKLLGEEGKNYEYAGIEPEFGHMSLKPAIGSMWAEKHLMDFYRHDYAIQRGKQRPNPKFYDQILKKENPELLKQHKNTREERQDWRENTAERLRAKREVTRARIANQLRKGI